MINYKQIWNGLRIKAKAILNSDTVGELEVDSVSGKLNYHDNSGRSPVVTESSTSTLTNKTFTSPVINTPTGIVKADVGLNLVDNTSDATKNAAAVALTNKTIDASLNTLTNVTATTNANLTGVITSVGNTSSLGSFSSAALATALTDETGTGAAVFGTSPTITSASIVTPTRLDLPQGTKAALTTYALTATDGQLVYATDTLETFIIKSNLLSPVGGGVALWVTGHAYSVNDIVEINDRLYRALTAHTSSSFVSDLTLGDWVRLDNQANDMIGVLPILNGGTGNTTGTATVNANLTGVITSVGNATSIASQTGTGTKFVMDTSPTLVTPNLGTPTVLVGTNITGTATSFTASSVTTIPTLSGGVSNVGNAVTVVTNANLTGPITSVGNATSVASQTGTGSKFVMDTSPTLVTPNIGVANGTSLVLGGTINANAILDIQSTTKAFMPPRMTTTEKNAIASPTAGMEVYDSTLNLLSTYNGSGWISLTNGTSDTNWTACTFSTLAWQGVGTVTNVSLQCRRQGPDLKIKGIFTLGTVTSSEIQIPLPSNFGAITTQIVTAGDSYGFILRKVASTSALYNIIGGSGLSYFRVSPNIVSGANSPDSPAAGNQTWTTGSQVMFSSASIPIEGWGV